VTDQRVAFLRTLQWELFVVRMAFLGGLRGAHACMTIHRMHA